MKGVWPYSTRADEAKHQAECDRIVFLLPLAKPESLPAAGDLIQIAARLASGAIPDETRRFLLFIGARLKKRELRLGVIITLRHFIELTLPVADDCEPLLALAAPEECDVLLPDCKSNILLMLNHALDFMKRPQLV